MAAPSLTYTLTNGQTADASQVMQNFNDLLNGITDGTKDMSISALTCAGTATLNGHVNLGNSSADDLTVTASLASTLPIKTTNSYDIGSTSLGLRVAYFGANSQTVGIKGSASMSETWTLTLPTTNGAADQALVTDGSGVTSWYGLVSGLYSPTATSVTDFTSVSASASSGHYVRVGNQVTVCGYFTATNIDTTRHVASITLPVATTFTSDLDAGGVCAFKSGNAAATDTSRGGIVYADFATNSGLVYMSLHPPSSTGAGTVSYSFTYTVK